MINYKIVFFLFLLFFSCSTDYIPKPKAYLKLDLPDKNYEIFKSDCPFFFDVHPLGNLDWSIYPLAFWGMRVYFITSCCWERAISVRDVLSSCW